jgi:hypothetical protein
VQYWLKERGIPADDALVAEIIKVAKTENQILSDEDILAVVKRVRG